MQLAYRTGPTFSIHRRTFDLLCASVDSYVHPQLLRINPQLIGSLISSLGGRFLKVHSFHLLYIWDLGLNPWVSACLSDHKLSLHLNTNPEGRDGLPLQSAVGSM